MTDAPLTDSPWFFGLLGPVIVVSLAVIYAKFRAAAIRTDLPRLFARRTPAAAFETCRAELAPVGPARIRKAYRWVQALVPHPDPPIQAFDDLSMDLFITRKAMSARLTDAEFRLNPTTKWHQNRGLHLVRTVRDLMEYVLRHGYEAQVYDPSAEPVTWP